MARGYRCGSRSKLGMPSGTWWKDAIDRVDRHLRIEEGRVVESSYLQHHRGQARYLGHHVRAAIGAEFARHGALGSLRVNCFGWFAVYLNPETGIATNMFGPPPNVLAFAAVALCLHHRFTLGPLSAQPSAFRFQRRPRFCWSYSAAAAPVWQSFLVLSSF